MTEMAEVNVVPESKVSPADEAPQGEPSRQAPVTQSRFLFVHVAALRAKQLRRGALPKIPEYRPEAGRGQLPHKAERIAMEEVQRGLIPFEWPDSKGPVEEAA